VKKKRCEHLEASAMMGALAWQAATIIKMFFLSRGEIARGLSCFSPGFSPLCAGVLLVCTFRPIRLHGTTFYLRESILELRTKDQRYHRQFTSAEPHINIGEVQFYSLSSLHTRIRIHLIYLHGHRETLWHITTNLNSTTTGSPP